jgi:hypothetical protein
LYLVLVTRWRKIGLLQSAAECLLSGETLSIFPVRIVSALLSKHNERGCQADRQTIEREVLVILKGRRIAHTRAHSNEDGLRVVSFSTLCVRSASSKPI